MCACETSVIRWSKRTSCQMITFGLEQTKRQKEMINLGFAPHHAHFCALFVSLLAAEIIDVQLLGALLVHPLVVNAEELLGSGVVALGVNASSYKKFFRPYG